MITHGTYSGYQLHNRKGERPCDPCREARNAYCRERRKDPAVVERETADRNARYRALSRLAVEFPARYRQLLAEERAR